MPQAYIPAYWEKGELCPCASLIWAVPHFRNIFTLWLKFKASQAWTLCHDFSSGKPGILTTCRTVIMCHLLFLCNMKHHLPPAQKAKFCSIFYCCSWAIPSSCSALHKSHYVYQVFVKGKEKSSRKNKVQRWSMKTQGQVKPNQTRTNGISVQIRIAESDNNALREIKEDTQSMK